MAVTRSALSEADIRTLVKGGSDDERAVVAHRLCRHMDRNVLSDEERAEAQQILRVMAADAAELVRRALAVTLKASPLVPRDVANRLARDVETVAMPILSFSPAFTDDDLIDIVRVGGAVRQVAIAKRPTVSARLTEVIVNDGVEAAVETVCKNERAGFTESCLEKAMARFEKSEQVLAAIAYRRVLPMAVTEKLVEIASDAIRDHLLAHHEVSPDTALAIALGAKERATIDLVDQAGRTADVKSFVAHLHRHSRLTASLLLRAVAQGHMSFFEWGMAELAGVPHHRTWLMIHDAGPLGLKAIYERAGLPARQFPAFRAAIDTFHSMEFDGGAQDQERFRERLVQRFLTQSAGATRDDVDYLLDKIDRLSADTRVRADA